MSKTIAVADFGKTNLRLLVVDEAGEIVGVHMAENAPVAADPYLHLDAAKVWDWLLDALRAAVESQEIAAVVPTTYGSTAALVAADGSLALPIMDYEAEPPPAVCEGYETVAPPYEEVFAPTNPGGLTLGRQLYWQSTRFADDFARARHLLLQPQYWAWRLCGIAATEITSLGAQTHLWNPLKQDYSRLVETQHWRRLLPDVRPAWDTLGSVTDDVASATGLRPGTPVLCGIHDSNANYLRYLGAGFHDFTLMSTGTWLIAFNSAQPIEALTGTADTVVNTDVQGRAVACSRFMAGREFARVTGPDAQGVTAGVADIARVIDYGILALPSFSDSGGPVPGSGGRGHIVGRPPESAAERVALATLYCALMSSLAIDLIGSTNEIIIDGGLAANRLYAEVLADLRPDQTVRVSLETEGTGLGAALLWRWGERRPPALSLEPVRAPGLDTLGAYAEAWRERVQRHSDQR